MGEVRASLEVTPIPSEGRVLIERERNAPASGPGLRPTLLRATRREIDVHWAEAQLADEDYRAEIKLARPPSPVSGETRALDVRVTTPGGPAWPGGGHALPRIR